MAGEDVAPATACSPATPIVATASVNWDRSPYLVSPGAQPGCIDFTVLGWLYTGGGATPALGSLQVTSAAVYSGVQQIYQGTIIDNVPDPTGTGQSRVMSQGCAPAGLTEGMPLTAVFWFRDGSGAEQAIAAPLTNLTLSH